MFKKIKETFDDAKDFVDNSENYGFFGKVKNVLTSHFIGVKRQGEIIDQINDGSKLDKSFSFLSILSAIIATAGLLTNNNAVIIGAMIIAPLMWPVLGVGMGVIRGDAKDFVQTFVVLMYGIFVALIVSVFTAWLIPFDELSQEIVSRTNPTYVDLIIALASGTVAALILMWPKVSNAIAGVAVAASLMPPLCVVGIGIIEGSFDVAYGSFLLFFANILAILIASVVVFWLFGFKPRGYLNKEESNNMKIGVTVSVVLFLLFLIPFSYFFIGSLERADREQKSRNMLMSEVQKLNSSAKVRNFHYEDYNGSYIRIEADILFPTSGIPRYPLEELLQEDFFNLLERDVVLEMNVIPVVL